MTVARRSAGALRPGEVHYHFKALLAVLFANASAYPFAQSPVGLLGVAALCVLVLTVRLHTPRLGQWPRRVSYALLLGFMPMMVGPGIEGGPTMLTMARLVGFLSFFVLLAPPEWGWTNMGCTLCMTTLAAAGLLRLDLSYAFCLGGFLICVPGLYAFGHIHEAIRVRGMVFASNDFGASLARRILDRARYITSVTGALAAGWALYTVLPKPALMPLGTVRSAGPANTQVERLLVGRGLAPRGGAPILCVDGPEPLLLAGQVFDRYAQGAWTRTPGTDVARMDRHGVFDLPEDVAGIGEGGSVGGGDGAGGTGGGQAGGAGNGGGSADLPVRSVRRHAHIILLWEMPDLLPVPQGARRITMASWHLLGRSPWYVKAWSHPPITSFDVDYVPPVSLEALGPERDLPDLPASAPERIVDPTLEPRIVDLTRSLVAGVHDPAARVLAIRRWLGENCAYDLGATTPSGKDPLTSFLLETRRGFCEHFATALAVMARCAGVPSRLVTGYVADEPSDTGVGGRRGGEPRGFLARPRDSHAWTQVFIPRHGWIVVDATEGARHAGFWDQAPEWLSEEPEALTMRQGAEGWASRTIVHGLTRGTAVLEHHPWGFAGAVALGVLLVGLWVWWQGESVEQTRIESKVFDGSTTASGAGVALPDAQAQAQAQDASRVPDRSPRGPRSGTDGSMIESSMTRQELTIRFDALCVMIARLTGCARHPSETPLEFARRCSTFAVPGGSALPALVLDLAREMTHALLAPPGAKVEVPSLLRRLEALERGVNHALQPVAGGGPGAADTST